MLINNVELEDLDLEDLEVLEKIDNAEILLKEAKEKAEELEGLQVLKARCKAIASYFDSIFGEGGARKIFNGKVNWFAHEQAYADLQYQIIECFEKISVKSEEINNKYQDTLNRMNDISKKYGSNRAQRRKK